MANGGFEIPVDIKPQVQDSGNTQKFFTDLANQGTTAINKVARAAGQPIKQEVIFEVQDGQMTASIRNTSELLKKMERAQEAAKKKEQAALRATAREEAAFRKKQIQDIERARKAEAKRLAELEKRAQAARAAELKKIQEAVAAGERLLQKEKQVNTEIGKRKALINGAMLAQKGSLSALQADLDLQKLRLNNTRMGTQAYRDQAAVVQKLQTQMNGLTASSKRSGASIVSGFIKAQVAMAALVATMNQFRQVFTDTFDRGGAEQRFRNLTDSAAEYEQAMRLAEIASADFGITQTEATKGLSDLYARLKGVGYGLTEVNTIYRGFNTLAIQAGVAAEDAAGAFFQLSQALGSGKLQGDELRSILERMPQVTQLIASEMGVAAGEIKELGAAGQITSDVIYEAMKSAAEGSADLTAYLTDAQIAMKESKQRAEEMRVALGEALQPAYVAILNSLSDAALLLATAFEKANQYAKNNAEQIAKIVSVGLEVAKIAASVYIVVKAYQAWAKAVALVKSIKAGLLAMTGPVGWGLIAAGAFAAGAAYVGMSKLIDETGEAVNQLKEDGKAALEKTRQEAEKASQSFKGLGDSAKESAVDAKEAFKDMQQSLKQITAEYKTKNDAIKGELELNNARIKTERSLLDLQKQQAQNALDNAKNAQQRQDAAKKIMELKMAEAKLQRQADLAEISAAEKKAALAIEELKIKRQIVKVEMSLAAARGEEVKNYQKALDGLKGAVALAEQQYKRQQAVSKEQRKQVQNTYELNKEAAKLAYKIDRVYKSTKSAASAAGDYAKEMQRAASAAKQTEKTVQSTSRVVARFDVYGNKIKPKNIIDWGSMTISQAQSKLAEINKERNEYKMRKARAKENERRAAIRDEAVNKMEESWGQFLEQSKALNTRMVDGVKQAVEFTKQQEEQLRVQFENMYSISNRREYSMVKFQPRKDDYAYMGFPTAGRRESGGPVSGGSTYTVNERGREGFLSASGRLSEINVPSWGSWRAPSSGEVIPAHVWSEMKAASSAVSSSASRMAAGGASGMVSRVRQSGDVDNSRVTNHVTIQSASPIQAASEVMVAAAKRRRRRFR